MLSICYLCEFNYSNVIKGLKIGAKKVLDTTKYPVTPGYRDVKIETSKALIGNMNTDPNTILGITKDVINHEDENIEHGIRYLQNNKNTAHQGLDAVETF